MNVIKVINIKKISLVNHQKMDDRTDLFLKSNLMNICVK